VLHIAGSFHDPHDLALHTAGSFHAPHDLALHTAGRFPLNWVIFNSAGNYLTAQRESAEHAKQYC